MKTFEKITGDSIVETKSKFSVIEFIAAKLHLMQFKPKIWSAPTGNTKIIATEKQYGVVEMTGFPDRDLQLLKLSHDIREGNCNSTVRDIRKHLRCSMNRAMELARIVKA